MDRRANITYACNCLLALIIGALIYYFFSPEVIFVKKIDKIIRSGLHFELSLHDNWILKFIRFYVLDMLWAYALVFALKLIMGNNTANLKRVFGVAFILSATMEILQLTPLAEGTFDMWDIICEFVAEVIAVFIIKNTQEEAIQ